MISDIMNIGLTNVTGELIKEDEWCVLNGINPDDDNLVNQIALIGMKTAHTLFISDVMLMTAIAKMFVILKILMS